MRRPTFLFLLFASSLTAALAASQTSSGAPPQRPATVTRLPAGIEVPSLDRKTNACTDFFEFACGGWMAANPMPADRQRWGRFNQLQDDNFAILRQILENPAGDADQRKASDYFAACMDDATIESRGLQPLTAELTRIAAVKNTEDVLPLVAHLQSIGVNVFFRFGSRTDLRDATQQIANIDQGGLGMPDRDYYLKTDARSLEIKQKYVEHVQKMLGFINEASIAASNPVKESSAQAIVAFETRLAESSMDRTARRDPAATDHLMNVGIWMELTPGLDWASYTMAAGTPKFGQINVAAPDYFKAFGVLMSLTPLEDLKVYLAWQLVNASAEMLPKKYADADFDFFSRTLGGQQEQLPRWQRCVTQTDDQLGEALGKVYVEKAFGPAAKADTLKMVEGIKTAMKQDIQAAEWMSADTKRAAEAKLAAVVDRIGYPDKWRDYSTVRVTRDDALGNMERAITFEHARDMNKIGKPVDRSEWSMTPPTVNAYYSPARNNINFPAGILQTPFYRQGRDAAVNYGGAGAVIGHELTHGFDDQGRKFDASGNLKNWWTDADTKAYEQRSGCVADQYSQYVVAGDTKLNGNLTLGENTADNGGARLALMAYLAGPGANKATAPQVMDGYTPEQRFFIGFAQIWCENRRPEFERLRATTDPHSSGKYRVNGVVSNMPEFQKAFNCKADAPMVRQNQCRVW